MVIGKTEIRGYAALAPMAGAADRAMRRLCMEYGASFCVTELISAKAVSMGDKKSLEYMHISDDLRPVGIQLFGADPDIIAYAAQVAETFSPDFIDINMGCPAPKVISSGGGSALLRDPALAGRITAAAVKAVKLPVSVKMRTGYENGVITAPLAAQHCEAAGAAFITVHGRTRQQMYAPPADWETIGRIKRQAGIPVIGNGDIFSPADAARMYEVTGCDLVMVGRGALGRPWLFEDINSYFDGTYDEKQRSAAYRLGVLMRHAELVSKYKGERTAMLEIRKHAAWYIKGIRGAAEFRRRCGDISSVDDLHSLCSEVIFRSENEKSSEVQV